MRKPVKNRQGDALARISWQDFERLLADHYQGLGYQVEHCGTGGSSTKFDGGIDLKLRKADQYILVQCKHWNADQVPHNCVHELMGVMDNQDATGAILITSGEFTAAAKRAAGKKGRVELIDGVLLREMLGPLLPITAPSVVARPDQPWREVVETGADVAFDAIYRRRGRRPSGPGRTVIWIGIAKLLIPFVFLVFAYLLFQSALHGLASGIRPTPRPAATVPSNSNQAIAPAGNAYPSFASSGATMTGTKPGKSAPVAEIGPSNGVMSPDDLADWKRKNEESMRVLEATTPELGEKRTKSANQ